jgi:transposase
VVDQNGATVWRGKCSTEPKPICETVRKHAPALVRVGLETGQLSNWLTLELRKLRLPIVCLDARHAKAALSLQVNKTDANDAHGLAQVVRTGWFREVAIKSMDAQTLRMLLMARAQLVSQRQAIGNNIRGLLKTFGLVIARGSNGPFGTRVREAIADNATLAVIVEPLLLAWQALREQIANFDRQVNLRAKTDTVARRLMTIPGVGVIVSLAYIAVIDDPGRFKRATSVGAYQGDRAREGGLTPRRYQSGEVDKVGSISKCGDGLLRSYLFEAANVLLSRDARSSTLKTWGLALASRIGMRRAKVAVARKLAVIMHRVWKDDRDFDWGDAPTAA